VRKKTNMGGLQVTQPVTLDNFLYTNQALTFLVRHHKFTSTLFPIEKATKEPLLRRTASGA